MKYPISTDYWAAQGDVARGLTGPPHRRQQRRQPRQEVQRLEDHVGRAVPITS